MTVVAALYDIHANLPALEAVLEEVREAGVDQIVIGGDVVPGPMPRETLERLLSLDVPSQFIRGNGDREVLARMRGIENARLPEPVREGIRWSGEQISGEQIQRDYEAVLTSWPATMRLDVPGLGSVLFCHATPRNDTEVFTRLTDAERLRPVFDGIDVPIVVCGHTHMQFDRMVGSIRVLNAGSVGMPFQEPGAYWLQLGPDAQVRLRRTSYDLARAADLIRATTYPQAEDFATRSVLHPPTEAATLEQFSRIE
jgi:putative phosphoesterase